MPATLTIANDGNRALPAGTRVLVKSVLLDAAGLVTGTVQPVLVVGANNNVRGFVDFSQQADASVLTLAQPWQPVPP